MFEIKNISHSYKRFGRAPVPVLDHVSFRVEEGERVVLLGINGSGKSTLLKMMDGLVFPEKGELLYRGTGLSRKRLKEKAFARSFRSETVLLFQNPDAMLFHPTVLDEIAFGPRQLGWPEPEEKAKAWAARLGLEALLDQAPFDLSGGQKQKVCLAALLALEPKTLLLDEPTAALDPAATGWLVDFLADAKVTSVVSTHDLSLAPELGSRAVVLSPEGRILYDGPVEGFLSDPEQIIAAGLAHRHRHKHGGESHAHFHVHDWK